MSLPDYIGASLDGPISALRRHTVALVIACAAAVGALFYGLSAAHIALVPAIGEVGARLAIAAAFVAIAGGTVLLQRLIHTPGAIERARWEADALTREQKIALIIEALLMGYTLSTRRKNAPERE